MGVRSPRFRRFDEVDSGVERVLVEGPSTLESLLFQSISLIGFIFMALVREVGTEVGTGVSEVQLASRLFMEEWDWRKAPTDITSHRLRFLMCFFESLSLTDVVDPWQSDPSESR